MVVIWQLKAVSFLRLLRQSLGYLLKRHESIESSVMSGRLFVYNPSMFLKLAPSSLRTWSWGKWNLQENGVYLRGGRF